jgi:hypothetical protein
MRNLTLTYVLKLTVSTVLLYSKAFLCSRAGECYVQYTTGCIIDMCITTTMIYTIKWVFFISKTLLKK